MVQNRYTGLIQDFTLDQPQPTFLSLSREIRDEIYHLALVLSSPIIVWKGEWKSEFYYHPPPEGAVRPQGGRRRLSSVIQSQEVDQEATLASLRPLAMNLILCNKTVGYEAARVFYTKNTFSFLGRHSWSPIISWLEMIGPVNRSNLVSMEINAYRPDPVWQLSSGERIRDPSRFTCGEVYQRHPYLQLHATKENWQVGQVDNINPAVEELFVLLGQRTSEQKATIGMQLPRGLYPGARMYRYPLDQLPELGWYSMDLPKLVEKSRSLHARQVEVLWEGRECRKELEDQQAIMESIGWDVNVLPATEDELHPHPEYHGCHPATDEWRIAKYVLRMRELTEPLWASDPNPVNYFGPGFMQNFM